jgi:hypothetical protein
MPSGGTNNRYRYRSPSFDATPIVSVRFFPAFPLYYFKLQNALSSNNLHAARARPAKRSSE